MSAAAQRLNGKTILITGASSGIGRSTALEFAATCPSIKLILTARRLEALEALASEIKTTTKEAAKVHVAKLDVSKPAEISKFIEGLPEGFREIDVLVNNAGMVHGKDKVGSIAEDDVDIMFATNVTGLIAMTQAVVKRMQMRGSGDIINIGSIAGREPYVGGSIYCATKAAVRAFTDSLRRELISSRIRVIEIDPGQVETEFSVVRFRGDKTLADKEYEGVEPLTPQDIAETVVFAASRRENVVVADVLVFPNHQAGAGGAMFRKPAKI